MPRLVRMVPRYRKHRPSGQAVVVLSGQTFYLGPHGTKASKHEYDRLVMEWLARGRQPLRRDGDVDELAVVELIDRYDQWAVGHYIRRRGKVASEVHALRSAARHLRQLYGRELINEFGPHMLKAVRESMIRAGWARGTINSQVERIVRMFRWGVEEELVRGDTLQALDAVRGLQAGRSKARETIPVGPVADAVVNATFEHLPPIVADMVRLQRLTGCRPEEVCTIRPCDVDTSSDVWKFRPPVHKTTHQGRERVIFIGPKGQDVLRPYLLRTKESYCFVPAESERKRREAAHDRRVTPLHAGNRPGTNRAASPVRPAGQCYTTGSYRRAIQRACELAFGMPAEVRNGPADEPPEKRKSRRELARAWRESNCWSPNQLRHSAATEIRKRFGLEASQVVLGHSAADVTQVYAERDQAKAAAVMAQVG
jgi:integrase